MTHALLFELNGIQSYLFGSGKLKDVIGASELLDLLTNAEAEDNLLDTVKCKVPDGDSIEFSRRAGGAFYAFCPEREPLEDFLSLWTLAIQQWAPDISYSIGLGQGSNHPDAFQNARHKMQEDQGRQRPRLPIAAPLAERNRRTGVVAETRSKDGPVDAATKRKRKFANTSKAGFIARFSPKDAALGWRDWPLNLEPDEESSGPSFPFLGEDRTIALIHADGNGLGQVLLKLKEAVEKDPTCFTEVYKRFSALMEKSILQAARSATDKVLLPARETPQSPLAARPIVLGGDDLTVIVRADLAIDYVTTLAKTFEEASRQELQALQQELRVSGLPERLTLGVGMVFLRASQPFYLGIKLVEDLMNHGKNIAKETAKDHHRTDNPEGTLGFQRITASLVDDYDNLVNRQLSHRYRYEEKTYLYRNTLGAYFLVDDSSALRPRLSDLKKLADLLGAEDMARGPTRQLLTLIGLSPTEARTRYRRWRQLMKENKPEQFQHYTELMGHLVGELADDLPYGLPDADGIQRTPLADALALAHVTRATVRHKNRQENVI